MMRTSYSALSKVGLATRPTPVSSASSSICHLSSGAKATRSARAAPLQNLVHTALVPMLPASKFLSPAARKHDDVKTTITPRPTFECSETSGRTLAKRSQRLTQASGSKVYSNRAHLINRMIRDNRILSAMAAFVDDVANPNRTPFSLDEMQQFVVGMRIQSAKHATTRPAPKRTSSTTGELWRPSRLDPSISAKSLEIPIQCAYAIAAIYDVCLERQMQPTAKMISAMLSSFLGLLSPDQMYQAAQTALQHLVPSTASAADQDVHLRRINHHALSSFIHAFGRSRKPEEGEALLSRWAKAQRADGFTIVHADEPVDVTGWGGNVVVWQSLIKSRVDADDMDGARNWLHRYRLASQHVGKHYPSTQSEPYLAYMAGIRSKVELRKLSTSRVQRVSEEVCQVVRLMIADHVPVDSSIIAFVLDLEARVGNVDGSATLIRNELSGIIEANQVYDAELLRALFRIHNSAAKKASTLALESTTVDLQKTGKWKGLPSSRTLIRSLVQVGEGNVVSSTENIASCRSRRMLNAALMTAMSERDYPAAVVVLNLFERWRITPSQSTYTYVINPLASQGHYQALLPEPGETKLSASKLNFHTTLQSIARRGDVPAALMRRTLGDQANDSDTVHVSARPSSTLRQTQYLVRILNKACAAEMQDLQLEGIKGEQDEGSLWKRVKSAIQAAQDELLGTLEERKDELSSSSKSLLLSKAPTLSPHRRGFKPASTACTSTSSIGRFGWRWNKNDGLDHARQEQSTKLTSTQPAPCRARPFSTSAVRRDADSSGASCDLASASNKDKDFTHLEPVRAVYIPGFVPYKLGLALQEHLVKQRSDARAALRALHETTSRSASTLSGHSSISASGSQSALERQASQDTLLLLQHRPVYTEGRRHEQEDSMVANHLRWLGADYYLTKRGGQITYHGPGQLVGYPILNLASMGLASRCYVDRIQDSLISLLGSRGVPTVAPPDEHTGVWADEYHKIASIGIQVRHRISSHGFALNVENRAIQGFKHIVACGIVGRNMTCLHERLDPSGPFARYNPPRTRGHVHVDENVQSIASSYKTHFAHVFRRRIADAAPQEFQFELSPERDSHTLATRLHVHVHPTESVVSAIRVDGRPVVH